MQTKAARIDDLDDAAFALRFECASRGGGRTSGGDSKHETARRHHRDPFAATPCSSGYAFHHAALCPVITLLSVRINCAMLAIRKGCLSEIVLVTKGARWK